MTLSNQLLVPVIFSIVLLHWMVTPSMGKELDVGVFTGVLSLWHVTLLLTSRASGSGEYVTYQLPRGLV